MANNKRSLSILQAGTTVENKGKLILAVCQFNKLVMLNEMLVKNALELNVYLQESPSTPTLTIITEP
jgi:hypothetical protein